MTLQRDSNGNLLRLADGSLMRECCCGGVPCTCPCGGDWPPASWPCGGLNETYVVSNGLVSPFDGAAVMFRFTFPIPFPVAYIAESRMVGSPILTATSVEGLPTCYWQHPSVLQQHRRFDLQWNLVYDWTDVPESGDRFDLYLNGSGDPCFWHAQLVGALAQKYIGNTPVGTYFYEYMTGPITNTNGFIIS